MINKSKLNFVDGLVFGLILGSVVLIFTPWVVKKIIKKEAVMQNSNIGIGADTIFFDIPEKPQSDTPSAQIDALFYSHDNGFKGALQISVPQKRGKWLLISSGYNDPVTGKPIGGTSGKVRPDNTPMPGAWNLVSRGLSSTRPKPDTIKLPFTLPPAKSTTSVVKYEQGRLQTLIGDVGEHFSGGGCVYNVENSADTVSCLLLLCDTSYKAGATHIIYLEKEYATGDTIGYAPNRVPYVYWIKGYAVYSLYGQVKFLDGNKKPLSSKKYFVWDYKE